MAGIVEGDAENEGIKGLDGAEEVCPSTDLTADERPSIDGGSMLSGLVQGVIHVSIVDVGLEEGSLVIRGAKAKDRKLRLIGEG